MFFIRSELILIGVGVVDMNGPRKQNNSPNPALIIFSLGRKEGSMQYQTSAYNTDKVRLTLWIPKSYKEKYGSICSMFGSGKSELFCRIVDEIFFEPLSPTLPKTLYNATQRITAFFRRSEPAWRGRVDE